MITYYVSRTFDRFKDAHWRIVVQAGLVPVSVGLFAAGAFVVARAADRSLVAVAITLATAAVAYWTRFNPLWLFAAAGLLGYLGLRLSSPCLRRTQLPANRRHKISAVDGARFCRFCWPGAGRLC